MMKMRFLGGLALLGLMACDSGPALDLTPGVYVLASVDGKSLPAILVDDDEVGRWVVHADTIFVFGGGEADRRTHIEVTGNGYIADTVMNDRRATNYRLIDGRLEVGYFSCPPNAMCTPIPSGELTWDGFTLDIGWMTFPAPTGLFRRAN